MVRVLAQYTRGPGFESHLRFDFSPPTFGVKHMSHFLNSQSLGNIYSYKRGGIWHQANGHQFNNTSCMIRTLAGMICQKFWVWVPLRPDFLTICHIYAIVYGYLLFTDCFLHFSLLGGLSLEENNKEKFINDFYH